MQNGGFVWVDPARYRRRHRGRKWRRAAGVKTNNAVLVGILHRGTRVHDITARCSVDIWPVYRSRHYGCMHRHTRTYFVRNETYKLLYARFRKLGLRRMLDERAQWFDTISVNYIYRLIMLFHIDLVLVLFRTSACPQRTEDIDGDFQVNKNDACFIQFVNSP